MKSNPKLAAAALALSCLALAPCAPSVAAQDRPAADAAKESPKEQERLVGPPPSSQRPAATPSKEAGERLEPDDTTKVRGDVPERILANRREGANDAEDSDVVSFNNFLSSYQLGPEDVISIKVFGLDRYTVTGVTVPPDGKVDYFHIRDGVHVAGKTTQQVADEIERHLDEYLIEPKVTVALEKAMSMR